MINDSEHKDFFKEENSDVFKFHYDERGNHVVSSFSYKEKGQKVTGTNLGDLYEIIIVPQRPVKERERLTGILVSPMQYIKRLLEDGFVGFVGKATTTSKIAFDDLEEKTRESYNDYMKKKGN